MRMLYGMHVAHIRATTTTTATTRVEAAAAMRTIREKVSYTIIVYDGITYLVLPSYTVCCKLLLPYHFIAHILTSFSILLMCDRLPIRAPARSLLFLLTEYLMRRKFCMLTI